MTNETKGLLALILNIFFPGVGTIIGGNTRLGVIQLVILVAGWILTFVVVGFFVWLGDWIWALITGIKMYNQLKAAPAGPPPPPPPPAPPAH